MHAVETLDAARHGGAAADAALEEVAGFLQGASARLGELPHLAAWVALADAALASDDTARWDAAATALDSPRVHRWMLPLALRRRAEAHALAGDRDTAMAIQRRLLPVHRSLFVESNPIPVKWAVARLGHCGATMRLPLTPFTAQNHAVVESALQGAGLL